MILKQGIYLYLLTLYQIYSLLALRSLNTTKAAGGRIKIKLRFKHSFDEMLDYRFSCVLMTVAFPSWIQRETLTAYVGLFQSY